MLLFQCASSVPELSAVQDAEFASARNSLNDSMYPTGLIPIARSTLIGICSFLSVFKNFLCLLLSRSDLAVLFICIITSYSLVLAAPVVPREATALDKVVRG